MDITKPSRLSVSAECDCGKFHFKQIDTENIIVTDLHIILIEINCECGKPLKIGIANSNKGV